MATIMKIKHMFLRPSTYLLLAIRNKSYITSLTHQTKYSTSFCDYSLKTMEQLGYITRSYKQGNNRIKYFRLTEKGLRLKRLLDAANTIITESLSEIDLKKK